MIFKVLPISLNCLQYNKNFLKSQERRKKQKISEARHCILLADCVRRSPLWRSKAEGVGFLFGQFPDGNCLRAGPRGARLSDIIGQLAHRSGLRIYPAEQSSLLCSSLFALLTAEGVGFEPTVPLLALSLSRTAS